MGDELKEVKEKEELLNKAKRDFSEAKPAFYSSLARLNSNANTKLGEDVKYNNYNEIRDNLERLEMFYLSAKNEITIFNKSIESSAKQKQVIQGNINSLEKLKTSLTEVRATYKHAIKRKDAIELKISKAKETIERVKPLFEKEKLDNQYMLNISSAYEGLISKLKNYNENLPIELAKELSDKTLEIYNSINRHSFDHEYIKTLSLPSSPETSIYIEFLDGTKEDALKILSEGHLKCLGLSILLAKNIKDKQSVIIFDDVVNAIDDEHRKGVRDTLFHHRNFSSHQLIITTHAKEFLSHLENMVGDYKGLVQRYDFCNKTDGRKVSLKATTTSNYIIKARQCYDSGDSRDCLMNLRRVLELLSPAIWTKIKNNHYDSRMSLQFFDPSLTPNLSNYLESLRKKIKGLSKDDDTGKLVRFLEILDEIINISDKNTVIRTCLNKATHYEEREEEFDDAEVERTLTLVEELNAITLAK